MLTSAIAGQVVGFITSTYPVVTTQPEMLKDAQSLMRTTRGLTQKSIRELMNRVPTSPLNYERYRSFGFPFSDDNAMPASLVFNGDVYRGFDARSLSADDLDWAQELRCDPLGYVWTIATPRFNPALPVRDGHETQNPSWHKPLRIWEKDRPATV